MRSTTRKRPVEAVEDAQGRAAGRHTQAHGAVESVGCGLRQVAAEYQGNGR